MQKNPDTNKQTATNQPASMQEQQNAEETRQQQTDPNLTELKGLTDPDEDLEVKGTDNDL